LGVAGRNALLVFVSGGNTVKLRERPKTFSTNCAPEGGKIAGIITPVQGESSTQGRGNDLGYGKNEKDTGDASEGMCRLTHVVNVTGPTS
jgi:hypothetical protein